MILCCGEGLIDFIPVAAEGKGLGFRALPGGSPFNVARALGRLGVPVGFLSAMTTDFFGDLLVEALEESRVQTSFITRLPLPSTLGFVTLKQTIAQYAFYDANAADREWTGAAEAELPDEAQALHFGSISLIREPAAASFEALFQREAGGGRTLCLDPNIRADMVRDVAAYRARLDRMMMKADIVKISSEDLHWLAPGIAFREVAATILAGRASLVAVTDGAQGAAVWTADAEIRLPAPPVTVVDTVGAGDSFTAGLLVALHEKGSLGPAQLPHLGEVDLRGVLRFAQEVAAITCTRQGADAPWGHELAAMVA